MASMRPTTIAEYIRATLEAFRKELEKHKTTKGALQIPYNKVLLEDLIRKIAEFCLRVVREREDDAFW